MRWNRRARTRGGRAPRILPIDRSCGAMRDDGIGPADRGCVGVRVVAAGRIGDARGVAAAITLGASAVQLGTAFLFCPEAQVPVPYREALRRARSTDTMVT